MCEKLKPCPHCPPGGDTVICHPGGEVLCWQCQATAPDVETWNTRAREAELEARVKELEELVQDLEPSVFNDECLYCAKGTTDQWVLRRDKALRRGEE